jgi:hypothetical protein
MSLTSKTPSCTSGYAVRFAPGTPNEMDEAGRSMSAIRRKATATARPVSAISAGAGEQRLSSRSSRSWDPVKGAPGGPRSGSHPRRGGVIELASASRSFCRSAATSRQTATRTRRSAEGLCPALVASARGWRRLPRTAEAKDVCAFIAEYVRSRRRYCERLPPRTRSRSEEPAHDLRERWTESCPASQPPLHATKKIRAYLRPAQ